MLFCLYTASQFIHLFQNPDNGGLSSALLDKLVQSTHNMVDRHGVEMYITFLFVLRVYLDLDVNYMYFIEYAYVYVCISGECDCVCD